MGVLKIYKPTDQFFSDERGWAFFPFQGDLASIPAGIDLTSFHVVKTEPGHVRGNHFHPETAEWLHVFGQAFELFWQEDGENKSETFYEENLIIFIPPNIPHAVKNIGSGPMYVAAFREKSVKGPHTRQAIIT